MNLDRLIYLDNNATTRTDPAVVEAMAPYWSKLYLNPASVAGDLFGASLPIKKAKHSLATALGGADDDFFLTSGATEANNWVLQSTVSRLIRECGECHLIISVVEHPSVLDTMEALKQHNPGLRLDHLPVDNNGVIRLEVLESLVTEETALVSIMLANNETGVIQPVGEAARITKRISPQCLFHTDATQAVGKVTVDLDGDLEEVDFLSLSAHKFHGPKGIGALFIRAGTCLESWFHGGSQQSGRRAGTENPAFAMGLAAAISLAIDNLTERFTIMAALRDHLEAEISKIDPNIRFLGAEAARLPNTALILVPAIEGELMVHQLLETGIATSTGSACSNGNDQPSHVITAMGIPYSTARNALRISLSYMTTQNDIEASIAGIRKII
jgi:cysteine desulfurase